MFLRALLASGIIGLCAISSFSTDYSVEVLPSHGSTQSLIVTDLNDSGWVSGFYQDGNYFKSVVWNNVQWDTIPGFSTKSTFAQAINNDGIVVGQSDMPTFYFKGFSYQNRTLINETPSNLIGSVYGINGTGVMCGFAYFSGVGIRAYTKQGGEIQPLGTLGGTSSFGTAINSSNQVAGRSTTAAGATEAFLYTGSEMISIAPPGAAWSNAEAINDFGFAVGSYRTTQGNRGFYYDGYQSFDVGMIGDSQELNLKDINNDGTAVGYEYIDENNCIAVTYEGGNLLDLNTCVDQSNPIQLGAAFAINNLGWIAVLASFDGINGVTVILKPLLTQ